MPVRLPNGENTKAATPSWSGVKAGVTTIMNAKLDALTYAVNCTILFSVANVTPAITAFVKLKRGQVGHWSDPDLKAQAVGSLGDTSGASAAIARSPVAVDLDRTSLSLGADTGDDRHPNHRH
jgi:hypothetical protein